MENLHKTNRSFSDVETNILFDLYTDNAGNYHLIKGKTDNQEDPVEGTEINGFYICAHSPITIKINGNKIIYLDRGQFYNLKEGETITHKKFIGFSKFTKA